MIGLGAGPVLLGAALRQAGLDVPGTRAVFRPTDRNAPAAGVFTEAGFREEETRSVDGAVHYVLDAPSALPRADASEEKDESEEKEDHAALEHTPAR